MVLLTAGPPAGAKEVLQKEQQSCDWRDVVTQRMAGRMTNILQPTEPAGQHMI